MPQFEFSPPFAVFNDSVASVAPIIETRSLGKALSVLRTRPYSYLTVSVLVTNGEISTLIPVSLPSTDLADKDIDEARAIIASCAELRFRSLPGESGVAASV